jgi:uncharacterized membrane protein
MLDRPVPLLGALGITDRGAQNASTAQDILARRYAAGPEIQAQAWSTVARHAPAERTSAKC